ncbi:hypothetical protein DCAR_0729150 [Daucus carota subsp. sativus]|uniref:Protein kinase domain-containing protein n=1 Tax=Daucus carota subsp. sativus TaxID=79200 RepID=A0AAF0XMD3_DAUCS|nr:hypothetical protein DCAR_0729150 [Daucus carota subsp. sativus]
MACLCLYIFLLLSHIVMSDISPAPAPAYIPADNILINCGAPYKDASLDGREWDTDSLPKFTSLPLNTSIAAFRATWQRDSVDEIPYSTARISRSKFTYTIPVSDAGQKFLRLYFYPTSYMFGFAENEALFSVDAANHNLLSNFDAFQHLEHRTATLVKEYVITVNQSRVLEVTFTPCPNSYAFVNGIEIVSIPDDLYIRGNDVPVKMIGQIKGFYINDSGALEKLYRLNVGGGVISPGNDTGMFRSWDEDEPYLLALDDFSEDIRFPRFPINYTSTTPPYTAPEDVYYEGRVSSFNMTWSFQVDSGFNYLLRLYFCDYDDQRVFSIFINDQTAEQSANVVSWSGGRDISHVLRLACSAVYRDYAVFVSDNPDDSTSKPSLSLALHPRPNKSSTSDQPEALLNGLEIFKVSQPGGSLALASHEILVQGIQERGTSHSIHVGNLVGGSLGALLLFLLIIGSLLFRRRIKKTRDVNNKLRSATTDISLLPSVRNLKFSVEDIKLATKNFDENFVIGTGGFGNVYKGYMKKGTCPVAIKRLNPSSRQGAHEFHTEITILSNLRHRHLVPLIGCCDDTGEMILVYEYMDHGTLRAHLYGGDNPPLSWKQRLQICIDAAKGLHYLHAGAERIIIHRDVKSTNILLDEKMVAKVSDFGLSKMGPSGTSVTHMSTIVKGSFGYLDPEYYLRRQLTTKSDVYSFGVVLFEVLCARPVIMQDLPYEQMNLAEWSRNCYRNGLLGEIVDKNVAGEITAESLEKFGEVGYSCLRDHGTDRPTMSNVVWGLESALQLQKTFEMLDHDNLLSTNIVANATSGEASTSSTGSDGFKSGVGSVFSDILNPNAR